MLEQVQQKVREINVTDIVPIIFFFCVYYFTTIMRFLTRYPPFSYFWKDRFFHHQNQDIRDSRRKVNELVAKYVGSFDVLEVDRDRYFLTLTGKFAKLEPHEMVGTKYDRMVEVLEKEDILVRLGEKGMIKILINNQQE